MDNSTSSSVYTKPTEILLNIPYDRLHSRRLKCKYGYLEDPGLGCCLICMHGTIPNRNRKTIIILLLSFMHQKWRTLRTRYLGKIYPSCLDSDGTLKGVELGHHMRLPGFLGSNRPFRLYLLRPEYLPGRYMYPYLLNTPSHDSPPYK